MWEDFNKLSFCNFALNIIVVISVCTKSWPMHISFYESKMNIAK